MKIYLIKKEKGKKYDSPVVCEKALGFHLEYNSDGAPTDCSISHTAGWWACAKGDCGLDIEEKGRKIKVNVTKKLHPLEQQYLSALSFGTSEWTNEFLHIWTVKEAYLKLKKTGLAGGLDSFSVFEDDLSYRTKIDGYRIHEIDDKYITGALICDDDSFEIERVTYAGKAAKPCPDYAADLLAIKPYSVSDLKAKLKQKGYRDDEIAECINSFTELGYLNDKEYALRFAENAGHSKKGSLYIKQRLAKSGIDPEDMPEADPEAEYERALELAKSIYKECGDRAEKEKMLARVGRRLAAQGYTGNIVYKVLAKLR